MKVLILVAFAISSASWASAVLFLQCEGSVKPKSMSSESCDELSDRCDFYAGSKFVANIQYIAREYDMSTSPRKLSSELNSIIRD